MPTVSALVVSSLRQFAVTALLVVLSTAAYAQAHSTRPVRLIVGAPAGTYPDSIARRVAEQFSAAFGRPVVVENRPGASGMIAMRAVARSKPDGQTIGLATMSQVVFNSYLYGNIPYDPVRDLAPIGTLLTGPMLIAAHPDFEGDSLSALIGVARKRPGEIQFAVPGNGSPPHIILAMLMSMTGTRFSVVPFKGGPNALANVLSGEVPLFIDAASLSAPYILAGRLKGIAVTSQERMSALPAVPTVAELGYPGLRGEAWIGLVGPVGMQSADVAHLNEQLARMLSAPDLSRYIEASGARVIITTPEQFSKMIVDDHSYWGEAIKGIGLRVE